MKKNKYYMHKKAKDTYIEVIKSLNILEDPEIILVQWWNLGFTGNPWMLPDGEGLPFKQLLEIKKSELDNWIEIDPIKDCKYIREKQKQQALGK